MKLIKPSFEIINQLLGVDGIYKQIELAGRTCYKSEDKITETSSKEFVDRMIKSGHGAMLEHGTVYLYCKADENNNPLEDYFHNPYSKAIWIGRGEYADIYVTTNMRVLVEHNRINDLKYLCESTEFHEKRITVRFICDRVTGESFLRHRAIDEDHPTIEGEVTREIESNINSFARESTRYCNYTKDKFDNQFTIIEPPEFYNENIDDILTTEWGDNDNEVFINMCNAIANHYEDIFTIFDTWYFANLVTQWSYNRLIKIGWKPQQARRVIPLDIKSPLVMTAFVSDWEHFFNLRCEAGAHPQAKELAIPLKEEFIKRGYIKNE